MTRVFVDRQAGFCSGVKHAIRAARSTRPDDSGSHGRTGALQVVSYGELIHNAEVKQDLELDGIRVKQHLEELSPQDLVIIRAHGISQQEEQWLRDRGISYVDLTCHRVKKIHRTIAQKLEEGFTILIVGDPNHPEVKGHLGYAGSGARVLAEIRDAENYSGPQKVFILAQTTASPELFEQIIAIFEKRRFKPDIMNTLCPFVRKRQEWIKQYAEVADAALIIGGKNSSNTHTLYSIAARFGPAFWIQSADSLDTDELLAYERVAVTAGASTPDTTIQTVLGKLAQCGAVIERC